MQNKEKIIRDVKRKAKLVLGKDPSSLYKESECTELAVFQPLYKKVNYKRLGMIIGACVSLVIAVILIIHLRPGALYERSIRPGFVSARSLEQIMFFYPAGAETENIVNSKEDIDYGENFNFVADNALAFIHPDSHIIYAFRSDRPWEAWNDAFRLLEEHTNLRVHNPRKIASGSSSGTAKSIFQVEVMGLFNSTVFNDFSGQMAVIRKGDETAFLVAVGTVGANFPEASITHIVRSFRFIEFPTAANPPMRREGYEEQFVFTEGDVIRLGEWGKAPAINKTDHPEIINVAVMVESVEVDTLERIAGELNNLVYNYIPAAREGRTWHIATIRYHFLGQDVSEVLPFLSVSAESGDFIRAFVLERTMDPDADGFYQVVVFYEAPTNHYLVIGEGASPLRVATGAEVQDAIETNQSEEIVVTSDYDIENQED